MYTHTSLNAGISITVFRLAALEPSLSSYLIMRRRQPKTPINEKHSDHVSETLIRSVVKAQGS